MQQGPGRRSPALAVWGLSAALDRHPQDETCDLRTTIGEWSRLVRGDQAGWGRGWLTGATEACGAQADGMPRHGVYVQTFGGFCLYRDGVPVPAQAWRRGAARRLLVCLLLADGHFVCRSQLAAALWPELGSGSAAASLRVTLHALRRVLQPGLPPRAPSAYLEVGPSGCRLLQRADVRWDVGDLRRALRQAEAAGDEADATEALVRGLAGVRGPWMPEEEAGGVAFAGWQWRLTAEAVGAATRLAEMALRAGRPDAAIHWAGRALELDPAAEPAQALVVRALAARGLTAQARAAYVAGCRHLREQLDQDPGSELRRAAVEAGVLGLPASRPLRGEVPRVSRSFLQPEAVGGPIGP